MLKYQERDPHIATPEHHITKVGGDDKRGRGHQLIMTINHQISTTYIIIHISNIKLKNITT